MEKLTDFHTPKVPKSFGTHDGSFHADEVTACALLMLYGLIDADKIIRTRDIHRLSTCEYVCDVGGIYDPEKKLFDHHQADYQGPLSSAGMVLKYLESKKIIEHKEYEYLNNDLIMGVDAHDNGRDPLIPGYCTFSHVISNFTPVHYDCSPEEQNEAFHVALKFAYDYLERLLQHFKYIQSCKKIVADRMKEQKEFLIFEQNIPWLESFFELGGENHPALFVIMPSGSHWKLRGIPPDYKDRMKVRVPLPKEWAGLIDDELKKASRIDGAVFCHKGRFISVWETREDALKALKYTLELTKEKSYDDNFRKNHQGGIASGKSV